MITHLSSTLLCSSLLTFSMGFPSMNQKLAGSGEHRSDVQFRRVTGISKSASHLGSSRLSVARLRSSGIRNHG
jgi:hypothetical protein